MTKKGLDYYMTLPYRIVLYPAEEGGYVVEIPDLPGCLSQGETIDEAMAMIQDAKRCWLETSLELGHPIPEPTPEEYSGKLNIRIPKSLHRTLAEKAKEEGTSLNQLIIYHLSRGTGYKG
ncbi:type II toxin-antitoxin system HicB family antitoxin [Moorella sulfitireducens]|uniref:type II toxin-antitoxin system HicB family antitoxin n=1 Tax=Neomoorella sulfitireducens TaxID=2972948 RepID=UPI0021ACF7EE|nr:type II toxin-antitoxin system HicB family antitoxin [Moorella sulfitireducens]